MDMDVDVDDAAADSGNGGRGGKKRSVVIKKLGAGGKKGAKNSFCCYGPLQIGVLMLRCWRLLLWMSCRRWCVHSVASR